MKAYDNKCRREEREGEERGNVSLRIGTYNSTSVTVRLWVSFIEMTWDRLFHRWRCLKRFRITWFIHGIEQFGNWHITLCDWLQCNQGLQTKNIHFLIDTKDRKIFHFQRISDHCQNCNRINFFVNWIELIILSQIFAIFAFSKFYIASAILLIVCNFGCAFFDFVCIFQFFTYFTFQIQSFKITGFKMTISIWLRKIKIWSDLLESRRLEVFLGRWISDLNTKFQGSKWKWKKLLDSDKTRYSEVFEVADYESQLENQKFTMAKQKFKKLIWFRIKLGTHEFSSSLITISSSNIIYKARKYKLTTFLNFGISWISEF